jgi:mannitol-1-phosphate 5-dehydrogenase
MVYLKLMKKVIIFGAGQIGRGFIGQICFESNYFIVFVDVDERIIDLLNKEKKYPIYLLGEKKEEKIIESFKGICLKKEKDLLEEFIECELIFTSVGAKNLFTLSEIIAKGIKEKLKKNPTFLNIVICENLLDAGEKFKNEILKTGHFSDEEIKYFNEKIGFVETVISRMTSPLTEEEKMKNPLCVKVEPYKILPIDKNGFKGNIPPISGFFPVDNLKKYEELKLFGHNLSHVCLAYSGYLKNYNYIWECIEDKEISNILKEVQREVKEALIKKHNFKKDEIENYFTDLNKRFDNKLLKDTVFRVGREPLRKIGKNERIVGAINLCLENNIFPEKICFVLSTALCYNYKMDEEAMELQNIIEKKGIEFVLKEICEIKEDEIINRVKKFYTQLKNEMCNIKRN